jgi:hypothetical protein
VVPDEVVDGLPVTPLEVGLQVGAPTGVEVLVGLSQELPAGQRSGLAQGALRRGGIFDGGTVLGVTVRRVGSWVSGGQRRARMMGR